MKTRLLFLTLLLAVLPLSMLASPTYSYMSDGITWNFTLEGGKATITGTTQGQSISGVLHIPATVEKDGVIYPVTNIKQGAFYSCPNLTGLCLEEGLETIEPYAFYNCTSLTGDLTIPSTMKNIEKMAFHLSPFGGTLTMKAQRQPASLGHPYGSIFSGYNNMPFSHVVLEGAEPSPLISEVYTGGSYQSVLGGSVLSSLTIRPSVQRLPDYALFRAKLSNIGSFEFPATLKEIGDYAFYLATFPTSTHVTIPTTITKVGEGVFANTNIAKLTEEAGVMTEVPKHLCSGCTSLTEVNLPTGITKLGEYCFGWCTSLTDITLPTGVTEIGNSALTGTALVNLPLPEGLTTIGKYAFSSCHELTTITPFPSTLTTIGDFAFGSCTKLQGDVSGFLPASLKRIGSGAFMDNKGITGEAVFPQLDPVAENDDMLTAGNPFLNTSVYGMRMGQWDKYFAPNESNNIPAMWNDYSGLLYIDARDCTVRLANGKGEPNLAYKFARHERDNIYKNFIATSVNTLIYLPSEAKFNDPALPAATFDQRFDTDENEWEGDAGANFIMDGKCELFYVSDWRPYRVPIAFTAQTAMYDREFNVTDGKAVSTLYLPYPTDLPTGMQAYTLVKKGFDEHGDKAFIFREVPLGTRLEANKPYIVRITDGQTHKLPVMHNVEVPVSPKVTGTDSGQIGIEDTDWKFYGTTEKIENADASAQKAYYLNGNKWWQVQDGVENDYIAPFRCYVSSPTGAAAAKSFVMVFEGEEDNTVTGIRELENDTESDIKSGKYPFYSVDGKLVGKDYDKLENGQIYIVNGKKFYKF